MDKPQSQREPAPPLRNPLEEDRGFAPGGGYSDAAAPFPEDDYRWRNPPSDGYGGQAEFDSFPKDEQRRTVGSGKRDRAERRLGTRGRSWSGNAEGHAQATPQPSVNDTDDVGYRRRASRDH